MKPVHCLSLKRISGISFFLKPDSIENGSQKILQFFCEAKGVLSPYGAFYHVCTFCFELRCNFRSIL